MYANLKVQVWHSPDVLKPTIYSALEVTRAIEGGINIMIDDAESVTATPLGAAHIPAGIPWTITADF